MPSPSPSAGAPAAVGTADIRTLALVGPAAAGKTLLAEALLQAAGVIGSVGSLERGSTVSDHDPLERKYSIRSTASLMHCSTAAAAST